MLYQSEISKKKCEAITYPLQNYLFKQSWKLFEPVYIPFQPTHSPLKHIPVNRKQPKTHTHTHFHKRSLVFWSGLDQNVSHRAHKDLDKHWKTGFHNRQIQSYEKPFRSMLTWTVLTFDYFLSKICNLHRSAAWAVDGSEIILQHLWIGLKPC